MKPYAYAAILAVVAVLATGAFVLSDDGSDYTDATEVNDTLAGEVVWSLHGGVLTVSKDSGDGIIGDYAEYGAPWIDLRLEITRVVINDGVTHIGNYTFFRLTNLASVSIPESVKEIGDYAFYAATNLDTLPIPGSVEKIGEGAFGYNVSLDSIRIPYGVKEIGRDAFIYCGTSQEVVIPASVESIGVGAFSGNQALRNIVFEGETYPGLTLGANSFDLDESSEIRGLVAYVWSSVEVFDKFTDTVLHDYTALSPLAPLHSEAVHRGLASEYDSASPNLPSLVSGVDSDSNVHWVYDEEHRKLTFSGSGTIAYNADAPPSWNDLKPFVKEIVVGPGIAIGDKAFKHCVSLESIDISSVTGEIGAEAFRGCYSLTSIVIPEGVTKIGRAALSNMWFLREVVIPSTVTQIIAGNSETSLMFYGDVSLTSVTVKAPRLGDISNEFLLDGVYPPSGHRPDYRGYQIAAISIYDDGSNVTPTRVTASRDAVVPLVTVVYYNDSVGGHVSAAKSLSGKVTLSGFVDAARIGTSWSESNYLLTALDGVPFDVSRLNSQRIVYAYNVGSYYTIAASIANGTITPSGDVGVVGGAIRVAEDGDATFAFSANEGYAIWKVKINGVDDPAAAAAGTHTFEGVTGDGNTIAVETTRLQFSVTASADSNSTITPAGSVGVSSGGGVTFAFSASAGYAISDVVVDGASVPSAVAAGKYAFSLVASNHTISVKSAPSFSSPAGSGNSDGSGSGSGSGSDGANDGAGDSRAGDGDDEGVSVAVILAGVVIAIAAGSAVLWLVLGRR
ncbi:MAG: leucine-rich repeat domain-containing protein [Candidatus Methanoplasma sp.]|jgi:hypothetical protein|nr:leucine-rich repeat domain-containing protein [Candidatus Methanoplasma sp.]